MCPTCDLVDEREPRNAPSTIPTHSAVAAICVVVHHPVIRSPALFDHEQPITAYTPSPITKDLGCPLAIAYPPRPIVNDDKVIPGAAHFCE
jgi:hypothetical protein